MTISCHNSRKIHSECSHIQPSFDKKGYTPYCSHTKPQHIGYFHYCGMWTPLAQPKEKKQQRTFIFNSSWFFQLIDMIFHSHVYATDIKSWRFVYQEGSGRSVSPFSILPVSLQLIHERPEDRCWFFLGLVLFQHSARQLTGQLFCFGSLACELSYGDYTWQAVRNWTGSSGKQGSATHLPFSAHSKHAHNNKKGTGNTENSPSFILPALTPVFLAQNA